MFNIENKTVKKSFKKKLSYAALALLSQLSPDTGSCIAAENITAEENKKIVTVGIIEEYFDPNNNNTVNSLTASTSKSYIGKSPYKLTAKAQDDELGGNHANHVTSIIHDKSPNAELRVIDLHYDPALKVINNGDDAIIEAINQALISGVDFINISRRISPDGDWNGEISEGVKQAFLRAKDAGIGIIKSAGNDEEDVGITAYTASLAKLAADMEGSMIMVTALNESQDDLAWFSNEAGDACQYTVAAPGEDIVAYGAGNIQVTMSGTSMAAPFITGLAAS